MNENINLCEILKGHEGETFWYYGVGEVTIIEIEEKRIKLCDKKYFDAFYVSSDGTSDDYPNTSDIVLFPSKDQRDWNKWIDEQKHKTPKTWSEIKTCNVEVLNHISQMDYGVTEPILKSALALLKIHQLIEAGYGGNTDKAKEFYSVSYDVQDKKFIVRKYENIVYDNFITSFYTKEQAEEFLSYPDNVKLLKDYFMV